MSLLVKDLYKSYGRYMKKNAVKGLSIEINKGEVYALAGHNGAGKTTIIKCILRFIKPDSGTVSYENTDICSMMGAAKIGYMPELLLFSKTMSMKSYVENLGLLRSMSGDNLKYRMAFLTDYFDLSGSKNCSIAKFSKGMKKKVNFIQAVIHEPEFLILDEPTDGLDPVSRRKMLSLIRRMADRGCTVLMTSHILADLERICDRVGLMHEGVLIAETGLRDKDKEHIKGKVLIKTEDRFGIEFENWYTIPAQEGLIFDDINNLIIKDIDISATDLEEWYFRSLWP